MYYIGVDLGGMSIKAGVVDDRGNIIVEDRVKTQRERHYSLIIKDMADLCNKVVSDANLKISDIEAIGVGSPGIPNKETGVLLSSNNLGFYNVPLKAELQKYFDIPIYIDNDTNTAALAESVSGASKGYEHSVFITLGTGIGGGIIINNQIYSGFNYAGSELGHMCIIQDGISCSCGRKGCFERYASASALIEQTKEAARLNPNSKINIVAEGDFDNIDAKTAFIAQRMNDEVADKVVEKYIEYLADGIMNIVNILFPEIIVIGGGLGNEGENLLVPLREAAKKREYTSDIERTKIVSAVLGNKAGIVGAAMLGMKE